MEENKRGEKMKILIAYTSRTGTTARCAEMLAKILRARSEVELCDMSANTVGAPENYDAVVLGSSVRMGRISKQVKGYVKDNLEALNNMPCAFFLCCGLPDDFDDYIDINLPRDFEPSHGKYCFGGELKPKNAKGLDRFILGVMRRSIKEHDFEDGNYEGSLPEIIPENIEVLSDRLMRKC